MLRKTSFGMLLLIGSSVALIHCAGKGNSGSVQGPNVEDDTQTPPAPIAQPNSSGPGTPTSPPSDAGTVDSSAPKPRDAGTPPVKPPPAPTAGPCQALNPCCAALDGLVDRIACLGAVFAHNDLGCTAAEALYCNNPGGTGIGSSSGGGGSTGTNCSKLQACCNSNEYIQNDDQCTDDAYNGDDTVCSDDLYSYQTDEYGDCQ